MSERASEPMNEPGVPQRDRSRYLPWLLLAVGVAVWFNSLSGRFVYDDAIAIVHNPFIRSLPPPWSLPTDSNPVAGRPVVGFSLAVNYAIGGLNIVGYHVANITVHLLAGLLLYGIVRRTLAAEPLRSRFGEPAPVLAAGVALLWLVHPIQTECVDYTTQRTESIMAWFYLLTLYCAIRARTAGPGWALAAVVACGLGMASKETMATAPVMVLLYDWAYRTEPFGPLARRRLGLYAGLAATWGILAVLMASGPRAGTIGFSHGVSGWEYALNQCREIVGYLRLVVWPDPLVLDYGPPHPLSVGQVVPWAAILLALVVIAAVVFVRRPGWGYPAVWFFVVLAPTSSLVPIANEVAAERRLYLPLAGLTALAVIGAYVAVDAAARRVSSRDQAPAALRSVVILVIIAAIPLIALTRARNALYANPIALWQSTVEARPDNERAHTNLGTSLDNQGRSEEAVHAYRRALEIDPDSALAHYNLGNTLARAGEIEEAVDHYRRAAILAPDAPDVHRGLGLALVVLSRNEEALDAFREAVHLDPDDPAARWSLGKTLVFVGDPQAGMEHLREALRIEPDWLEILWETAWVLATSPVDDVRNGAEAVRLAERAAELASPDDALTLDILATAYAEAGDFEKAVATERKAIAAINPDVPRAEAMLGRLKLYENGLPFRSGD